MFDDDIGRVAEHPAGVLGQWHVDKGIPGTWETLRFPLATHRKDDRGNKSRAWVIRDRITGLP